MTVEHPCAVRDAQCLRALHRSHITIRKLGVNQDPFPFQPDQSYDDNDAAHGQPDSVTNNPGPYDQQQPGHGGWPDQPAGPYGSSGWQPANQPGYGPPGNAVPP